MTMMKLVTYNFILSSAPDPTTSLYDSGIAIQSASDAPPTPLLLSDDDECFSNSTTVLSSAGSELPHTPKSGHVLDLFTPSHAPDFYRPLLAKQPPPHHRMQSTRYDCMRRNNDIVHRPQWTLKRNVIVLGKTRPSTYVQPLHPVSSIIQTSSMQFEINMASTDNLQHFFSKLCLWLLRRYSSKKKKEYFAIEANEPQDDPNNQLQQIFQDAKDKYLSHTIYLRAFR
ncbi:uncharacterized protein BYT42DRAFT_281239 [Radiomyces spectabilis]|uniref:uncharacterized protein n=1 Tax=Radiomyces spectabilis TaxID=64574 RepID=UPI00221FF024|nr:uncharacterized protein BYT42DRAFT_281239 [Radiomyces spectabilis]KAI8384956.1 hypothetical protein BYT42DRAFT_281239 [Radiomyces spectabilis]